MEGQPTGFYEFGSFRIDRRERLLLHDGEPVPLPPKVYDTLLTLVMHSGHVVAKEELMSAIWPDTFVEEANLTVNVSALRKVLGEGDSEHHYIETVPRRGYRFVLPVTEVREDSAYALPEDKTLSATRGGLAAVETAHQSAALIGKATGARPTYAEYVVGRINQHKLALALVTVVFRARTSKHS